METKNDRRSFSSRVVTLVSCIIAAPAIAEPFRDISLPPLNPDDIWALPERASNCIGNSNESTQRLRGGTESFPASISSGLDVGTEYTPWLRSLIQPPQPSRANNASFDVRDYFSDRSARKEYLKAKNDVANRESLEILRAKMQAIHTTLQSQRRASKAELHRIEAENFKDLEALFQRSRATDGEQTKTASRNGEDSKQINYTTQDSETSKPQLSVKSTQDESLEAYGPIVDLEQSFRPGSIEIIEPISSQPEISGFDDKLYSLGLDASSFGKPWYENAILPKGSWLASGSESLQSEVLDGGLYRFEPAEPKDSSFERGVYSFGVGVSINDQFSNAQNAANDRGVPTYLVANISDSSWATPLGESLGAALFSNSYLTSMNPSKITDIGRNQGSFTGFIFGAVGDIETSWTDLHGPNPLTGAYQEEATSTIGSIVSEELSAESSNTFFVGHSQGGINTINGASLGYQRSSKNSSSLDFKPYFITAGTPIPATRWFPDANHYRLANFNDPVVHPQYLLTFDLTAHFFDESYRKQVNGRLEAEDKLRKRSVSK